MLRTSSSSPGSRFWLMTAALAAVVLPARAADPHRSFDELVGSNGHGAFGVSSTGRRADAFFEHIYRYPTPDVAGTETRDFLHDAYFGLRVGGEATWLTEVPLDESAYVEQTGVVRLVQSWRGLRVETWVFAPWDHPGPALVLMARVSHPGTTASLPVTLYAIQNLHLGAGRPEPGEGSERIVWDAGSSTFAETGPSGAVVVHRPLGAFARHACSPDNPYPIVSAAGDLPDTFDSGVRDDAVAGFQFDLGSLAPGAVEVRGVVLGLEATGDAAAARARLAAFLGARGPQAILDDEIAAWNAWRTVPPAGLGAGEVALWRQSEAILRMGQVRETGRGHGQILASLPPGRWNISWVRDMAYAIVGLVRSGHYPEARDALRFMLEADAGEYESYVGAPYRISVTRYFGNGREESDWNEDGPNIEFDGFGLFLWALGELIDRWDDPWWEAHWTPIRDQIAEVLVGLRDPETGMIAADSSIWEVHWNGRQKRYTYTSLCAARGLCVAADLARRRGDTVRADAFEAAATGIRDAVLAHAVAPDGALAQSVEELRRGWGYRDAAVVEAIHWGLIPPDGATATATLDSFLVHLRPPSGRGFFRNDDGGWYDSQEWVFCDLRSAEAFRLAGRTAVADDLLDWITAQAAANHDLIAELHDANTADYRGETPMVGFGAGNWIIAREAKASGAVSEPPCGDWPGADGDADADADADAGADGDADADADADAGADGDADAAVDVDAGGDVGTDVGGGGEDGCGCAAPGAPGRWNAIGVTLFAGSLCRRGRRRGW